MNVLVLNSGSSSLKFQVIDSDLDRIKEYKDDRICRGEIEGIGAEAVIRIRYQCTPDAYHRWHRRRSLHAGRIASVRRAGDSGRLYGEALRMIGPGL